METNLLAVNASIEAARAGEEGQGFAVVASEVGQLAAQSAAATKEIQQIVDSIQQETTAAVKAIKASSDRVEEGTQQLERTKQSLGKIAIVSRQIDELLQSISQATVSQVNTSEMVTQLMEEIAKVSQKNSGSSIEVSGALQETVEIAKQLQKSVGTFKVA
jgi:methyl-accepting chemotaxis protein PixJ